MCLLGQCSRSFFSKLARISAVLGQSVRRCLLVSGSCLHARQMSDGGGGGGFASSSSESLSDVSSCSGRNSEGISAAAIEPMSQEM